MADANRKRVVVVLASLAIVLAGVLLYRMIASAPSRDSVGYLAEEITIRCTETDEEWKMNRGRLERDLYTRPGRLDPSQGIANPTTGKPTGFPVDREREWDSLIARINAEKDSLVRNRDQ